MSLITQMLNDLDKRGANQASNIDPLATAVRTTIAKENTNLGPAIIAAAVIIVLGIGGIVWWQSGKSGALVPVSAPVATPVAAQVAATETPVAAASVVTPAPAPPASAAPAAVAPKVTPPPPIAVSPAPTSEAQAPSPPIKPAPEPPKPAPKPKPEPVVSAAVNVAKSPSVAENKPSAPSAMKTTRPDQRSENLYKQGVTQLMQGRQHEAIESLNQALAINPAHHDARVLQSTAYVDLLRADKAVSVLESGISAYPEYLPYTMNLARLQASRKQPDAAIAAAQRALPVAGEDPDFHALLAALLQQKGKHGEAADHYLIALRSDPMRATWLVGAAISLQSTGRGSDAAKAYQRALDTGDLSPAVTEFALQNLAKLR